MAKRHRLPLFIFLFLAIVLVVVGIQWTASDDQPIAPDPAKSKTAATKSVLVNEQPWRSARRLAKRATSKEEADFAQEAMRLSDQELDIAFNTALRQAHSKLSASSPETLEMRKRVRDLEAEVKSDQADIKRLTAAPEGKAAAGSQQDLDLRGPSWRFTRKNWKTRSKTLSEVATMPKPRSSACSATIRPPNTAKPHSRSRRAKGCSIPCARHAERARSPCGTVRSKWLFTWNRARRSH